MDQPPTSETEARATADEKARDEEMALKISKMMEARMSIKLLKEDRQLSKIVENLYLGSYGVTPRRYLGLQLN